jgi:hypothetical protein
MGNVGIDFSSLLGQFGEPFKKATSTLKAVQDKALSSSQQINLKMLDIAKQNTTSTLEAMKSFTCASDMSEALSVQQAFVRDQAAAGMAQMREVGDMVAKVGREALAPVGDMMKPKSATI